ncbi:MAG: nucleotidyltransferase domain-containing protein [Acidobacteriia bacterium]|nr:nucleotidyltransferase domain-containing protein [Terriglobia bacterium]
MDGGVAIFNEASKWSLANLARIASEPLRAAGVKRAVAFGSYARGVADAWSDLDLVVVMETELPKLERGRLLGDRYDALPVSLDVLVFTPAEFEQGLQGDLDVFAAIATEGIAGFPLGPDVR